MARNQITGGKFSNLDGSPNANGYLKIQLNRDCKINSSGQVGHWSENTIQLDSNGNVSGTVLIWPNDQLSPTSKYIFRVFSSLGQLVAGPYFLTIPSSPSPYPLP